MTKYTFKHDTLYLVVYAKDDKSAVSAARRAIQETASTDGVRSYLKIELTGGATDGRLYLEPREISAHHICKRESEAASAAF